MNLKEYVVPPFLLDTDTNRLMGLRNPDGSSSALPFAVASNGDFVLDRKKTMRTGGRIVLVGDSFVGQVMANSVAGNVGYRSYLAQRCFFNWFQAENNYPFDFTAQYRGQVNALGGSVPATGGNQGYGSSKTFHILERLRRDVVSQDFDVALLSIGTNNVSASDTTESIYTGILRIVHTLMATGAQVWVMCILPRSDNAGQDSRNDTRLAVNTLIRGLEDTYPGQVFVIDGEDALKDPATGLLRDEYSYEGLHFNSLGARTFGRVLANKLKQSSAFSRPRRAIPAAYAGSTNPFGNILINPAYTGSSGTSGAGHTGSVPTNWLFVVNGGAATTITSQQVSRTNFNGDTETQVELVMTSPGGGADTDTVSVTAREGASSTLSTNLSAAEMYYAEVEVTVSRTTGNNILRSAYLEVRDVTDGTNYDVAGCFGTRFTYGGYKDQFPNDENMTLILRTMPFRARSAALQFRVGFDTDGSVAGSRTAYVGRPILRRFGGGYVEEQVIPNKQRWEAITANQSGMFAPARSIIRYFIVQNTTANAVTGGVRCGTTATGTDVFTGTAVAGNATVVIPVHKVLSLTTNTRLFFEAVTSWNSASLNVWIVYDEF